MSFTAFFELAQKRKKQARNEPIVSLSISPDEANDAATPPSRLRSLPHHAANPSKNDGGDHESSVNESRKKKSRKRRKKESSGRQPTDRDHGTKRRRKAPPTRESIELSEQLASLSRQKKVNDAIRLYWHAAVDVRDEHHACMVVDCCARCGHGSSLVKEAERVAASFARPNVELQTALLKAYVHAGLMGKAQDLFLNMCQSKDRQPNFRTLNTVLRGCLWTPTTLSKDGVLVGGVTTSEKIWDRFKQGMNDTLDASSYEYSISLLCQSLRVEEAEHRINELQSSRSVRIKGKASIAGGDCDVLETLAVVYLSLARAHALLGSTDNTWISCQRALSAASACRSSRPTSTVEAGQSSPSKSRASKTTDGGKRSWKSPVGAEQGTRRVESNLAYREHRLKEIESDVRAILKLRKSHSLSHEQLWSHLARKLMHFPYDSDEKNASQSATSVWFSCGGQIIGKASGYTAMKFLQKENATRKDGTVDLDTIFEDVKGPLDVELGSGYGDWITTTAASEPNRRHIAVELRADRVHQVFTKSILRPNGPLANLCVVGSDALSFLRLRLQPGAVSTIFVHHPEPPTQTFGSKQSDLDAILTSDGSGSDVEPSHMLNSETLVAAGRSLRGNGKIVIVTDNRSYGRLVCATLAKVMRQDPTLYRGPSSTELQTWGLRQTESLGGVTLHERHPTHRISSGSANAPSSSNLDGDYTTWFDRLWKTGASSHAERHTRFVVLACRKS